VKPIILWGGVALKHNVETRIAVLWIIFAVAMTAHYALFLVEPGGIEKVTSGEMEMPTALAMAETLMNWLIPLSMAYLTLALKDTMVRKLNMVLGLLFTLIGIFHLVTCPILHLLDGPSPHQLLLSLSTTLATVLVFWHAYKIPKIKD
jgi:hypothetical protein